MLLKDVKPGEVYAGTSWGGTDLTRFKLSSWEGREWETFGERALPFRADEVGVHVPGYRRPGVRGVYLDRETLEPLRDHHDETKEREASLLAVNLIGPWEELKAAYHDWLDEKTEKVERQRIEREREQARKQEKAAKDWMEREFESAHGDLIDAIAVLGVGDGALTPTDAQVQALVDRRHPDGNPYLNGTWTAH